MTGMKYLLGTFSQGWNARRSRRGHVFQGRYKSIPVSAATESLYYFRIAADYIHLNPARAKLAGGKRGSLSSYKWSSLPDYARGKGPDWLVTDRLLGAFELSKDGRGRRAYVAWLEKRAANDGGKVDEAAMKALKRGWYLGEPTFADKLLAMVVRKSPGKRGRDAVERFHDEAEAERLAVRALATLALPPDRKGLARIRKGDGNKVLVAALLRDRTSVGNGWLAKRLEMGHPGSVSRLVGEFRKDTKRMRELGKLERMLKSDT